MEIYYDDAKTTLYLGDCKKVMQELPDNFVDLVLTDPPYTAALFRDAYKSLGEESPRLMKYGASLVTLAGQFCLDEEMQLLRKHLKFNWIVWMNQPMRHIRMRLGIEVTGMPNLWYVKSNKFARFEIADGFDVKGTDGMLKPLHPWQKDLSWADHFVLHLTKPGDVVLDPFCGSGTTLVSAKKHGRIGIGIEIDEENCKQIVRRLNE